MAEFFASIPKRSKTVKNNEQIINNLDKTTMKEIEVNSGADDDGIVAMDDAPNGHLLDVPCVDPTAWPDVCGGSFSSSDQTNLLIKEGLQLNYHYHLETSYSGVTNLTHVTTVACSIFHPDCEGLNAQ